MEEGKYSTSATSGLPVLRLRWEVGEKSSEALVKATAPGHNLTKKTIK